MFLYTYGYGYICTYICSVPSFLVPEMATDSIPTISHEMPLCWLNPHDTVGSISSVIQWVARCYCKLSTYESAIIIHMFACEALRFWWSDDSIAICSWQSGNPLIWSLNSILRDLNISFYSCGLTNSHVCGLLSWSNLSQEEIWYKKTSPLNLVI